MPKAEHVAVQIHTAADHILFTALFRIPGKNKTVVSISKFDGNRVSVAVIGINTVRGDNCKASASKGKSISYRRVLDNNCVCRGGIHKFIEQIRGMYVVRA